MMFQIGERVGRREHYVDDVNGTVIDLADNGQRVRVHWDPYPEQAARSTHPFKNGKRTWIRADALRAL